VVLARTEGSSKSQQIRLSSINWLAAFLEGSRRRMEVISPIYLLRISFSRDLATCLVGLFPPPSSPWSLPTLNRVFRLGLLDADA
jgi:hypothetical protein